MPEIPKRVLKKTLIKVRRDFCCTPCFFFVFLISIKTHCMTYPKCLSILRHLLMLPLLLGSITDLVWAQHAEPLDFNKLKNTDGLSQNSVHSIIQDRYGFIWMGTEDGLNRYDGTRFKIYKHNPTDPNSLSDSFVRTMLVDRAGNLWIGTDNGGLNRYNYETDNFTSFKHNPQDSNSLVGNQVWALEADFSGKIWVGTNNGLSAFDPQHMTFQNFQHDPSSYTSLGSNWVRSLYVDTEGQLWVGADPGGLHLFLGQSQQFLHFWATPSDRDGMTSNRIFDIAQQGQYLWIATYEGGLVKFDKEQRKVVGQYGISDHLALRDLRAVLPVGQKLWILTRDRGVLLMDTETETFTNYTHEDDDSKSISSDLPLCITIDEGETIWIGTSENGVNKYNSVAAKFTHIRPGRERGIAGNAAYDFAQDTSGYIWVATNAGLFRSREPETVNAGFERWEAQDAELRFLLSKVQVITASPKGVLWLGTRQKLIRLNPYTNEFRATKISGGGRRLSIQAILPDSRGYLWVGTSGGLYRFLFEKEELEVFTNNSTQLAGDNITTLFEDSNYTIWVGTETGLSRFNSAQGTFISFKHDPENRDGISNNRIITLTEDHEKRLWVGTANGLNRWNPTNNTFDNFFEGKNQLPNGFIKGLLCDADNNLWISTNNGLSRMDASNETFVNFSTIDGLQGLEFLPHSCLLTREGGMLFGGTNGFNWFRPASLTYNVHPPRAVITDIRIFGKSLKPGAEGSPLQVGTMQANQLRLPSDQNVISFEFAALDFVLPSKNRVRFRLAPLDKEWRYDESGRNMVEYSNVPPGNYTFQLRALNNDGTWGKERSLKLNIPPPLWQTRWFQGLSLLLIAGLIYAIYRYRIWQIERQRKLLEQQVQERTMEIQQKNDQLEAQKKEILTQNQELEQQASEIQQQHDQINQQNNALKASHDKLQQAYGDIEKKNQSITDSIRYAKTIQEAVLPTRERIAQRFSDSFILYLPKAIVSGDFFWSVQRNDYTFVAAVDCTGHGVPGAFMSLIGNTLLNEIVNQDRIYEPAKILERLHVRIRLALKQAEKANQDGMDMILCRIGQPTEGKVPVCFSGAKRPLYVYHGQHYELLDFKGDRRSIGGRQKENTRNFSSQELQLPTGSTLYLTTDGFSDQISPERQKYGSNHLKNLLFKIAPLSLSEQEQHLRHTLQAHRQHVPQIDDVTILGLRL